MGRSKLKKRLKREVEATSTSAEPKHKVPIKNLPEKFVWMHVKSGTKIRNVFAFALKEFPNHNSIVWTGIGQGIAKAISCAELFKRHHKGLHQVTKLCYTESESKEDTADGTQRVPHIHILLTKDIKDPTEPGYQAPEDCGEFPEKKDGAESKTCPAMESSALGSAPSIDVEEFAAMGLRIGQKRFKRNNNTELPSKKIKNAN